MTTVTISDDQGQLTISLDGEEPQPLESVEQACVVVEQTFSAPEEQTEQADNAQEEGAEQAFGAGFKGVRGGGMMG